MLKTSILVATLGFSSNAFSQDIHELIAQVETYHNQHPEKSWDQIDYDLFFSQQLRRSEKDDDYDYASILDYLNALDYEAVKNKLSLTPSERALFNQSPSRGLMTIKHGYTASQSSTTNYYAGLWNGNGDAFRHCYWNALMTVNIEREWAKSWTDAHEDFPDNPYLEKSMDLNNNLNGQQIGAARPGAWDYQLESACLAATKVGRLIRIVNDSLVPTNDEGRL